MRSTLTILVASVLLSGLGAKNTPMSAAAPPQMRSPQMEMMVIWRLTEELKLTEDQAEKLFPRMRQHREEIEALNIEQRELMKSFMDKAERGDKITNKEFESTMKKVADLERGRIDKKYQFLNDMEDVLNNVQRVKLSVFQERIKDDIRRKIKERNQFDRFGPPPGPKRGGFNR